MEHPGMSWHHFHLPSWKWHHSSAGHCFGKPLPPLSPRSSNPNFIFYWRLFQSHGAAAGPGKDTRPGKDTSSLFPRVIGLLRDPEVRRSVVPESWFRRSLFWLFLTGDYWTPPPNPVLFTPPFHISVDCSFAALVQKSNLAPAILSKCSIICYESPKQP